MSQKQGYSFIHGQFDRCNKTNSLQRLQWAADGSVASVWRSSLWLRRSFHSSELLWAHCYLHTFSKTQWLYHPSGNDSSFIFTITFIIFPSFFFHPNICSTSLKFGFQTWVRLDLRVEAPLIFHIFVVMKLFHRYLLHFQSYLALARHTSILCCWYIRSGFYTAFWAIWSVNWIIIITISAVNWVSPQ